MALPFGRACAHCGHLQVPALPRQEERSGQDAFNNYYKLLEKKLKDPSFGFLAPIAYFGGTYRATCFSKREKQIGTIL